MVHSAILHRANARDQKRKEDKWRVCCRFRRARRDCVRDLFRMEARAKWRRKLYFCRRYKIGVVTFCQRKEVRIAVLLDLTRLSV